MHDTVTKRVLVWGGWLRLSHASIGVATPVLLLTGWLIAESPSLAVSALDVHYLASSLLLFGLVVRIILLLGGKEQERLPALFPASSELVAMARTLRFYISLGKASMPGWYAHNPLWKPLYLVVYLALLILAASGAVMPNESIVLGFYVPSVHVFWAKIVLWFSVLHTVSVIAHDYRNKTTDISAMVNGYRLFIVDGGQEVSGDNRPVQVISLDAIGKRD